MYYKYIVCQLSKEMNGSSKTLSYHGRLTVSLGESRGKAVLQHSTTLLTKFFVRRNRGPTTVFLRSARCRP
jgi:hypothetical protein